MPVTEPDVPPDVTSIAASFDARAATYARNEWHLRVAERLVALCDLPPGGRVLDAGTGTGFAALAAARVVGPSGRVLGVDISRGMLREAALAATGAGLTQIEWRQADATALAREPDASFDIVLCAAGLLYMRVDEALREWRRLLVPGGSVAFSGMQAGSPPPARLFRECAAAFGVTLRDPSEPLGTPAACRAALRRAGFTPLVTLTETIDFSAKDLEQAWDANLRCAGGGAALTLDAEQLAALKTRYLEQLAILERNDPKTLRRADLLYAVGRR